MQEIELKLQVSAAARRAVAGAVAGDDRPRRVRLRAAYFDTAGRALALAGLALRVRREGRRWVQTLKGAGDDGLTRDEHNVPLPAAGAEAPPADPALHAATPVGKRLLALLAATDSAAGGGLACRYRTDVRRLVRRMAVDAADVPAGAGALAPADAADGADAGAGEPAADDGAPGRPAGHGLVELAFDEGFIMAGERRLTVCELEIELVDGSPLAVIAAAWDAVERHGLWLDTRSKAERGDLLARGETAAAPRRAAVPVRLEAGIGPSQAWRLVLLNCFDQIAPNASQVADGRYLPEHVHQLRVGLRRLRSALQLFRPARRQARADGAAQAPPASGADPQTDEAWLAEQAATLFRKLGAARDAEAIGGPVAQSLRDALRSVGLPEDDLLPLLPAADAADPAACVRDAASQHLLLGLMRMGQQKPANRAAAVDDLVRPPPDSARALRRLLAERLQRWHRQVKRDAGRFAALDDPARHRLRKRVKRLRYAVEFVAALYPKKATAAYAGPLRRLQDRLGLLNDLTVAIDAYRRAGAAGEPRALFALGWLAARREALLDEDWHGVDAFLAARRFWAKRP